MDCSYCLQPVSEQESFVGQSNCVLCYRCLCLVGDRYHTRIVAPAGLRNGQCTFCGDEERGLVFTVGSFDVVIASLCLQCFDESWDKLPLELKTKHGAAGEKGAAGGRDAAEAAELEAADAEGKKALVKEEIEPISEVSSVAQVKIVSPKAALSETKCDCAANKKDVAQGDRDEIAALLAPVVAEDAIWTGSCPACHRSIDMPTHCISYSKFLCTDCIEKLRLSQVESLSAFAVNSRGEAQCYGCGTKMYRGHHVDRRVCLCGICRKRFLDTESLASRARCKFCLFPIEEGGCEFHCKYCEAMLLTLKKFQGLDELHPKTPRELEQHTFLETNLTLYSIAATLIHIRYLYDWPGAAQRIIPQLIGAYEKVSAEKLNETYGVALERVLEIHRSLEPK